jgi:hypothetical protein
MPPVESWTKLVPLFWWKVTTARSLTGSERNASCVDKAWTWVTEVSTRRGPGGSAEVPSGPSITTSPLPVRTGNPAISASEVSINGNSCKASRSSPVESRNHCSRLGPLATIVPRSRKRPSGSEPASFIASAAVATASEATGAGYAASFKAPILGHSSSRSSLAALPDGRRATPVARTRAPSRYSSAGWLAVCPTIARTRRPSTTMCMVITPKRSSVIACAIPSTSIHCQSTFPSIHSAGDVRLAVGSLALPSGWTFGLTSVNPLCARRVAPQTSTCRP